MSEHTHGISRRSFIGGAAIAGAASLTFPSLAFATPSSAEIKAEKEEAEARLSSAQWELEKASEEYYGYIDEMEAAQEAMEAEQAKIDEANEKISNVQGKLASRANSMYRTKPSSLLDFLVGATSFEEFATNWDLLNDLNANDMEMVEEVKDIRAERELAKAEYSTQKDIAEDKANEAEKVKDQAEALVVEISDLVTELGEEYDAAVAEEKAAEEARRRAEEEAAAAAAAAAASGGSGGGGSYYPSSGGSGAPVSDCSSVVEYALSRKGCPYVWGAAGPDTFDCSGLVTWAYAQMGIYLPHQSEAQYNAAKNRVPVSEARPGDVLWRYGHVGIAVGYGGVPYVHAPTFGAVVRDTDSLSWSGFTCALQF